MTMRLCLRAILFRSVVSIVCMLLLVCCVVDFLDLGFVVACS